jgi:trans-aconitate methyltransferase
VTMPDPDLMQDSDTRQQMTDLMFGYQVSQAVRAVADLSLADHLASGGLTAAEVAEREGSAANATFRLMRAAVAVGLLTADSQGRFHSTPLLATLRKDAPRSLRPLVMAVTNRAHWLPWGEFVATVRCGHTQASAALGVDFFTYLEQNPDLGREFSAGMSSVTAHWARDVTALIDTTHVSRAVDVGGANGALLQLLQQANPLLHGVIFDRPHVVAELARSPISERTTVAGGDFFESVPRGDLYLLKFILHDWDDDSAATILRRCREAMEPGGRIAIIEMIVGDLTDPGQQATLMDLGMLAALNGRERSLREYDALLESAGLRRTAVQPTSGPQSVIEAVAATAAPKDLTPKTPR